MRGSSCFLVLATGEFVSGDPAIPCCLRGTAGRPFVHRRRWQPLVWSAACTPRLIPRFPAACLCEQGYDISAWNSLLLPPPGHEQREFGDFLRGWQHRATLASDKSALGLHVAHSDAASLSLLVSAGVAGRAVRSAGLRGFPNLCGVEARPAAGPRSFCRGSPSRQSLARLRRKAAVRILCGRAGAGVAITRKGEAKVASKQ